MTCPNCGAVNPDDAEVCGNCGERLQHAPENQEEPRTSGLALASLVFSIIGFLFCFSAVAGVVLGYLAMNQIRQSGGRFTGEPLAKAGIAIGLAAILLTVILSWILIPRIRPPTGGRSVTRPTDMVVACQAAPPLYLNIVSR